MAWPRLLAVAACARVAAGAVSSGCGVESTDILEYVGMDSLPLSINDRNHVLTLPQDYDYETPVPLVLYMHGWGGDASEGDPFASTARKRGVATAALEGGGPENWKSWNAGGSSSSPGPRGATCKPGSTDYCSYYTDTCDCDASDGCWWTTCEDSTQVLLDALEAVKKMLCVDLEQVWVAGCSNGAMMVYEALADPRSSGIFAGGVSIVGAPHPGFWRPPASSAHLLGIWGLDDTTIPYEASADAPGPGVALATVDEADERGWYYTAARNVTRAWSLHHGGPAAPVSTNAYGNGEVSCATFVGASRETVECTVKAGHVCGRADEIETALGFIQGRRGTSSDKSS
jgi:poly(3-hydroxybutyrate) depolymerase